jgi:inorganic triphosphatase YgiF
LEIEAKFKVVDAALARKLRALDRVADYSMSAPSRYVVHDTFFDTPGGVLLRERNVLRVRRRSDGNVFLTLKTSATREGAVHSRPEIEAKIVLRRAPRVLHVHELPARFKKLLAPLVDAEPLFPLITISQTREVRMLRQGRQVVGEWSLDRVKFRAGSHRRAFYELEIELKKAGMLLDLNKIAGWLEREFHLAPEQESKFARALHFTRGSRILEG